jgi:hypothetical protein
MSEEKDDELVSVEVVMMTIEPGGEDAPGIYWTMDDTVERPVWVGPFPDEETASANASEAMTAAYLAAIEQLFGE